MSSNLVSVIQATPPEGLSEVFMRCSKTFDKNIRQALEAVAPDLANAIRKNIFAQGARGGRDEWIIVHNPTPLQDTGELFNSFEGSVRSEGSSYMVIAGTDKEYARLLNEGGTVRTDVMHDPSKSKSGTGSQWFHALEYYKDFEPSSPAALERHDKFMRWLDQRKITIPKREFMFLDAEDVGMVEDKVEQAIAAMAAIEGLEEL